MPHPPAGYICVIFDVKGFHLPATSPSLPYNPLVSNRKSFSKKNMAFIREKAGVVLEKSRRGFSEKKAYFFPMTNRVIIREKEKIR